ncbi:hypothetical protein D9Q98_007741 [Chlorella vulgaris]|uniref:Uncharacterized protein n=1 Tax=Chlorella vulgaris TaxID=3077 RepID=A0A9D4THD5_CHLVU|nr:hypothetical protein D9Q98_007741 [Chlorella vulgaris]
MAEVRSLTRDVGALREALRQEEKKRERLAAHAKGCEEAATGAQAQVKQLAYVNSKLEQELHTVRERAEASSAKSRGGLEAVRLRLAEVEGSVHQRSVQAHRHVQRVHSLVQDLQAAVMPLAVAAAAGQPPHAAALKSPFPGRGSGREGAQQAWQPKQLHRHFSSVFGGLSQLAALFSGSSAKEQGGAAALLLIAPDGSTKSVRWQDQSCCGKPGDHSGASPAGSAGASSRDGGCHGAAGSAAAAAAAAAGTGADQQDRERLAREVQRLRAALAEARQRLTTAEAASSSSGAGGGRVEAAMRQLEAVVPQYRAAASSLQGQVNVLKEKLAAAEREHAALQEELSKWRSVAQTHEASYAEAAARLHTQEAQSLAANTQVQSQTGRLQSDVEGLRRRCAELASRLKESQHTVEQLQGSLASTQKLSETQQQTIAQLEGTIQEQQADIRSALELVSSQPKKGAAANFLDEDWAEELFHGADSGGGPQAEYLTGHFSSSSWQAETGSGGYGLPGSAAVPGDAAAGWTDGFCGGPGTQARTWAPDADEFGGADPSPWHIPAVGGADSWWQASGSRPASPAKSAAAAAGLRCPPQQQQQQRGKKQPASAAHSQRKSPAPCPALSSVEADIAGLEAALKTALGDLHF